jgi:hypothetical protein
MSVASRRLKQRGRENVAFPGIEVNFLYGFLELLLQIGDGG